MKHLPPTVTSTIASHAFSISCKQKNKKNIKAECVVIFTDGYLENDVKWDINSPTLWLVTQNKGWIPPAGKVVFVNN